MLAAPNCPKGNKIKAAARTVPPGIASLAVLGLDLVVLISLKKKEIFSSEQDRSLSAVPDEEDRRARAWSTKANNNMSV